MVEADDFYEVVLPGVRGVPDQPVVGEDGVEGCCCGAEEEDERGAVDYYSRHGDVCLIACNCSLRFKRGEARLLLWKIGGGDDVACLEQTKPHM